MTNATTVGAAGGSTRTRRIRATLIAGAALAAIAVIGLADATPAFAHDELLGSSPEAEQVFDTARPRSGSTSRATSSRSAPPSSWSTTMARRSPSASPWLRGRP